MGEREGEHPRFAYVLSEESGLCLLGAQGGLPSAGVKSQKWTLRRIATTAEEVKKGAEATEKLR